MRTHPMVSNEHPAEAAYAGALPRIRGFMLGLGPAFVILAWWRLGWRTALGLAGGCVIAYGNFHWLERAVEELGDRIVGDGKAQSSRGMVARFLLRYIWMAAGGYVILTVSRASLYGFLAGLFLPVAAIACEAAYEAYLAWARGL
jgi:hypothetical protein